MIATFMGGQGARAGSIAYSEEASPTLRSAPSGTNTTPDVVYPTIARTLTAEHDSSPCVDRGQNVVVHDKIYQNTGVGWWNEATVAETLRTPCGGDSTKANLVIEEKPPRKYIVRRLTPLECCRLQGFPDWWETGCDDRVKAFRDLRSAWPEFDKQFRNSRNFEFDWNWYRDHLDTEVSVEGSDSARYKMWGNGIALPCAADVLRRLAKELDEHEQTTL